jgi:hypothetical protein
MVYKLKKQKKKKQKMFEDTWAFKYNDKFGKGELYVEKWDDGTYSANSDSGWSGSGFKSIKEAKEDYAKFQSKHKNPIKWGKAE